MIIAGDFEVLGLMSLLSRPDQNTMSHVGLSRPSSPIMEHLGCIFYDFDDLPLYQL
jgi:hypothetical protein